MRCRRRSGGPAQGGRDGFRSELTALLVALVALAGCTQEAPRAEPSRTSPATADVTSPATDETPAGRTLRVGLDEPTTLLPADATSRSELALVDALFDSLTAWSPTGEVVPRAAVRWEGNADATRWTFRLRPDATFHNGAPVTAADVRFAWDHAAASGASGYHLRDVEGYEAVVAGESDQLSGVEVASERTLEITLSRPNADFPAVLAHPSLAPIPAEAWSDDPESFRTMPVGNGPFAMAEPWDAGEGQGGFVRALRFEQWRNAPTPGTVGSDPQPVGLAEVVFRFVEAETAFLAFQQERLDVAQVPDEALGAAVERYGRSTDGYAGSGVLLGGTPELYALGFNTTVPPFDDPEVRRAIGLAVDRAALADAEVAGNVSVARAIVPAGVPGARRAPCEECTHQPSLARSILAQRGVTEAELWTTAGAGHELIAERLRSDLEAVGVTIDVRTVTFAQYLSALREGDAAMFRLGWAVDYPTAGNALEPLFHSSAIPAVDADIGHNVARYESEDVDALLEEARATLDPEARLDLYQQAEDLLLNRDHAVVPLLTFGHQLVVADRVVGLAVSPMGTYSLDDVELADPGE